MKCIIFIRGNGANKNYFEEQKAKCEVFAEQNEIAIIGVTESFDEALKSGADAVLVADHSRISRDQFEYAMREKEIEMAGMNLISAEI